MKRQFREEPESQALPMASRSVEQEGRAVQTPPRTRADVAPLSAEEIVIAVVDFVFAVVSVWMLLRLVLGGVLFAYLVRYYSPFLVGASLVTVGTLTAGGCMLVRKRMLGQVFQAVAALGGLFFAVHVYLGVRRSFSDLFWVLVFGGFIMVLLVLPVYVRWLTRRNGEG